MVVLLDIGLEMDVRGDREHVLVLVTVFGIMSNITYSYHTSLLVCPV